MSIVLQSTSGGSVTINEPTTASNFTQTLPAAAGTVMVSGNQPAFSAYQSTFQTLPSASATKIQLQTKEFDTASAFDNVTNYRFTPQVAGYYQVNGGLGKPSGSTEMFASVYKNGSEWKRGSDVTTTASAYVSCIVYLNGSTDYIELYGYMGTGANTWNTSYGTYFQASMVRAA